MGRTIIGNSSEIGLMPMFTGSHMWKQHTDDPMRLVPDWANEASCCAALKCFSGVKSSPRPMSWPKRTVFANLRWTVKRLSVPARVYRWVNVGSVDARTERLCYVICVDVFLPLCSFSVLDPMGEKDLP